MSAIRRVLPAVLALAAAWWLGAAPSALADGAARPATAPVLVILDASGSMTTTDAPGPRIEAAKHAVDGLVGALPTAARVGLEVFGTSTGSAAADKPAGCKDIRLVIPVGPIHRTAFVHTVSRIHASGYTPIGRALQQAAAALPHDGPRSIVLVSDGEDTCAPPDPCTVAEQLKRQGTDLVVHTVGFKVDTAARRQLQCIANVTGGTYRDANDGPSLSRELTVGVQLGLQPYAAVGSPIAGAATAVGAPQLQPGRQYLDTFDRGGDGVGGTGTAKFYTIEVHRGQTPYVSATVIPGAVRTPGSALAVDMELTDLAQTGCDIYATGYDIGVDDKVSASTAVLTPGAVGGPQWSSGCPTDGTFAVEVIRRGDAFADQPLKMELDFQVGQPADTSGLPAPAQPGAVVRANPTGAPRTVTAGSSFNDAPLVGPGVYRDGFVSGETRFFKFHLDWGQRVSYVLTPAKLPGLGIGDGVAVYTRLASPVRGELAQPDGAVDADPFAGSTDGGLYGSSLVPARYTNRDSTDESVRGYSLAGDYYLIVSSGFTGAGRASIEVPYTLGISVTATAEPGPTYAPVVPSHPTPPPSTAKPRPSPSPVAAHSADNSATGTALSLPAVAGALAALLLAGAVLFAVRRRRLAPETERWIQ